MGNVKCIAVIECYWTTARKTTVCHFFCFHPGLISLSRLAEMKHRRMSGGFTAGLSVQNRPVKVCPHHQRDAEDHSVSVPLKHHLTNIF